MRTEQKVGRRAPTGAGASITSAAAVKAGARVASVGAGAAVKAGAPITSAGAPVKTGAPATSAGAVRVAPRVAEQTAASHGRVHRPPRAPFVLLVVGLLCGGLVSLLLLNTVLAQDSFELNDLRASTDVLRQQAEELDHQMTALSGPAALAELAKDKGAVPDDSPPKFVGPGTSTTR